MDKDGWLRKIMCKELAPPRAVAANPAANRLRAGRPMRCAALLACVVWLVGACAGRAPFHTEQTIARVSEVTVRDGGPSGPAVSTLVVPVGGVFVPITVSSEAPASPHYWYTLKTASGETLRTEGTREFRLGQCVSLWHAPRAAEPSAVPGFVAGTLEASDDCR